MIQNYSKCELCIHKNVCMYKNEQKEVLEKMNGRLDNICSPEFFKFSFECKNFYHKESSVIK